MMSLRLATETDLGYIYKSWSNGVYASAPYNRCPEELFRTRQRSHMDKCLDRGTTLVLSPPGDPDTILGWLCYERTAWQLTVHWINVRNVARGEGCGRLLMAAAGWREGDTVIVSQWGKQCEWIGERVDLAFDPWAA